MKLLTNHIFLWIISIIITILICFLVSKAFVEKPVNTDDNEIKKFNNCLILGGTYTEYIIGEATTRKCIPAEE